MPPSSCPEEDLGSSPCPPWSPFLLLLNLFFFNRESDGRSLSSVSCVKQAGPRELHEGKGGGVSRAPPLQSHRCLTSPARVPSPSVSSQEEEERGKRQVLVLGLDGAGKSSMLQGLSVGGAAAKRGRCRPTRGFNFISLDVPACQLDFLESKAAVLPSNTLRA